MQLRKACADPWVQDLLERRTANGAAARNGSKLDMGRARAAAVDRGNHVFLRL